MLFGFVKLVLVLCFLFVWICGVAMLVSNYFGCLVVVVAHFALCFLTVCGCGFDHLCCFVDMGRLVALLVSLLALWVWITDVLILVDWWLLAVLLVI